jgi:formylglycine-generating enzyme required for sulfatase activity
LKYVFSAAFLLMQSLILLAQNPVDSFKAYQQTIPGTTVQFEMVAVKGGSFLMGSNNKANAEADEMPQKKITLSPFWMGSFEVSRDAFDVFYEDESTSQNSAVDAITRPSPQYIDLSWGMGKQGGYPVNSLSQYAALMYCRWLYQKTGIFYRLPTEAEWEYACRANSSTAYYYGDNASELDKYAWYKKNSGDKFQKSGQKMPNAFGLYDMIGNVSEWTLNHYDEKAFEKIKDTISVIPAANKAKYPKVIKGGSYADEATALRSANRIPSEPVWNRRDPQIPRSKWWLTDAPFVGFRIIRPLEAPSAEAAAAFFLEYLGK